MTKGDEKWRREKFNSVVDHLKKRKICTAKICEQLLDENSLKCLYKLEIGFVNRNANDSIGVRCSY